MTDNSVACDGGGRVSRIAAPVGTRVCAGDLLLVVDGDGEQIEIQSPVAGIVKQLVFTDGDFVPEFAIAAIIEN